MIKVILAIIFMNSVALCSNQTSYSYLGTGYDLKNGNPDGPSIYTAEMDPGLRPTRYIVESSKIGYHTGDPSLGCPPYARCALLNGRMIRRYVVDGMDVLEDNGGLAPRTTWRTQYRDQIDDKVTVDEERDDFWSSLPLEHLDAVREVEELVTEKNFTMITEEIWNVRASARVAKTNSEPIWWEFRSDLCNAIDRDELWNHTEAFPKFFERWGTHVINEVTLGYKEVTRYLIARADFLEHGLKGVLPTKKVSYQYWSYTSSKIAKILENLKRAQVQIKTYRLKFGDESSPLTPLRIHLVPVYEIADIWSGRISNDEVKARFQSALKKYLISD